MARPVKLYNHAVAPNPRRAPERTEASEKAPPKRGCQVGGNAVPKGTSIR
jgi:hypothetical protein